ncbi:MAG: hypothetical protein K1X52_02000 [Pyrinomonadaceae bacterium]|nr:hypothetical protein [Pyrinomonadaceae bacterium]
MIKIKAWLTHKGVRKVPIHSGYRPAVFFIPDHPTSGAIRLLDREELLPGERAIVEITPVSESLVGNPASGEVFKIGESPRSIVGEIEVIEVIRI